MSFNPLDLIKFASLLRYVPDIIKAIQAVELLFKKRDPAISRDDWNKERQDAAIAMVLQFLGITEGVLGRDLLKDEAVEGAMRKLIDVLILLDHAIKDFKALRPDPVVPDGL